MNRRSWLMSLPLFGFLGKKKKELKFWGALIIEGNEGFTQLYSISNGALEDAIWSGIKSEKIELLRGGWPMNVIKVLNPRKFLGKVFTGPSKEGITYQEATNKLSNEICSWKLQSGDVINFYSGDNPCQRVFIIRVI